VTGQCIANAKRSPQGHRWDDASCDTLSRVHDKGPAAYRELADALPGLAFISPRQANRRTKEERDMLGGGSCATSSVCRSCCVSCGRSTMISMKKVMFSRFHVGATWGRR
jgi:hypothetical protein